MFDHLNALQLRASNEKLRLAHASTPQEMAYREMVVSQCEKEITGELQQLGLPANCDAHMSDDELLAALLT